MWLFKKKAILFLEYKSKYAKTLLIGSLRNYIIKKVKEPLKNTIIHLARKYPEPTRENCLHPNTHILFDIREKFFKYEDNPENVWTEDLIKAAWKLLIATYEHDLYYRFRIDWILEQINKSDWQPRTKLRMPYWRELGRGQRGKVTPESIQDVVESWRE